MFKRILVAVDGSEHSIHALNVGVDLAKRYSAEVILLNVIPPFFQEPLFPSLLSTPKDNNIEEAHKKMLSKVFADAKKLNPYVKISKKLVSGRAADMIIEFAKVEDVDLIVIGNRGLGGIKEFILGSVSDKVVDHATCPVLIVK